MPQPDEFIPAITPEDVSRLIDQAPEGTTTPQGAPPPSGARSCVELLGGDDETFAYTAYRCLLGREPDPEGLANCLAHLGAGRPRLLVLGGLRYSAEGRRHGVKVPGLWPRYIGTRLLRRRATAWLARPLLPWGMRLLNHWERRRRLTPADLEPLAQSLHSLSRQIEAEATGRVKGQQALRAALDELRQAQAERAELLASLGSLPGLIATKAESVQLEALRQRAEELTRDGARADDLREVQQSISHLILAKTESAQFEALRQRVEELARDRARADELFEARQSISHLILAKAETVQFEALRQRVEDLAGGNPKVTEMEQRLADLANSVRQERETLDDWRAHHEQRFAAQIEAQRAQKYELLDQSYRLQLLLNEARRGFPEPLQADQMRVLAAEDRHAWDVLYAAFEDRFRGTREDIRERLRVYLPELEVLRRLEPSGPVVDLGCGRGEWLELLDEAGHEALGVDLNRLFLRASEERGLRVIEADALEYLRGCHPESLGAVTAFHLIEHLPFEVLLALLDAARRALRPGGVLILETPNPENLRVGAYSFYIDPTHRNPIPPITAQLMVMERGFVDCRLVRLHPPDTLDEIAPASDGAGDSNGPTVGLEGIGADYGLIARKAERHGPYQQPLLPPDTEQHHTGGDDH